MVFNENEYSYYASSIIIENQHLSTIILVKNLNETSNNEQIQSLINCIVQTLQLLINNGL